MMVQIDKWRTEIIIGALVSMCECIVPTMRYCRRMAQWKQSKWNQVEDNWVFCCGRIFFIFYTIQQLDDDDDDDDNNSTWWAPEMFGWLLSVCGYDVDDDDHHHIDISHKKYKWWKINHSDGCWSKSSSMIGTRNNTRTRSNNKRETSTKRFWRLEYEWTNRPVEKERKRWDLFKL